MDRRILDWANSLDTYCRTHKLLTRPPTWSDAGKTYGIVGICGVSKGDASPPIFIQAEIGYVPDCDPTLTTLAMSHELGHASQFRDGMSTDKMPWDIALMVEADAWNRAIVELSTRGILGEITYTAWDAAIHFLATYLECTGSIAAHRYAYDTIRAMRTLREEARPQEAI